ncbi:Na+/melibiose symporter-like transporter [Halopolyspora algeriensis]|uniref:Na+/melibiose symporter-like transporter n=1 Tax=Halopolyspora algeriensis TaxID=1500506 RepID=A0A368VUU3_9ACTN|nr:MFS transporter [Halopolyspora algeriensis]RCW44438.1 Na+/melibiose symporter-like transporter [Halopolyspora algeriensis]TQM55799.1 Na+/melibiose symporter-like transporter [Halopolyspora algeriensis]
MTAARAESTLSGRRPPAKLMAAGLVGSSIEWYDFFIYATAAALVFGPLFFPGTSPLIGTLLSFSTFWAGFIARPIGGLIFGHFGDRLGRKPALVTCLTLMGAATFLIGVLPTSSSIGVAAPILLVALRFLQGIAVGGQWGGLVLLLTESAGSRRRGLAGTFGQMGVPIGVILGNTSFLLVSALVSPEAFLAWGWRIPFLASAALFPVVLFIQLRVEDTPVFRELQQRKQAEAAQVVQAPLLEVMRTHGRRILLGSGLLFASNAIFYISIAGVLDYGTRELGLPRDILLLISLASSAVGIAVILAAGALSDRMGRRPLILAGAGVIAVWAFPFFWLVDTGSLLFIAVAVTVGGIGSSLAYGPLAAYLGELFEPRVRYSGVSLAYQLAAILISGGTPFIMTALLAATGTSTSVSVFLLIMGLATFLSAFLLPETGSAAAQAETDEEIESSGAAPAS